MVNLGICTCASRFCVGCGEYEGCDYRARGTVNSIRQKRGIHGYCRKQLPRTLRW